MVLELKVANVRKKETLQAALKAAQKQLQERSYDLALRQRGADPVHQRAVAWLGKEVLVASVKPPRKASPKLPGRKSGAKKRT